MDDIPLFETDLNLTRVNNYIVIMYIVQKMRVDYLWQWFLNSIILKYLLKSVYCQYKEKALKNYFIYVEEKQSTMKNFVELKKAEFYKLVNSQIVSTSKQDNEDGQAHCNLVQLLS